MGRPGARPRTGLCCPCLWWLINIVLMFTDKPYRQGLQDKAAKTVVVAAR
ncbi:hypothetical protein SMICM17S_01182 [Streptomyces microflavus]